MYRFNSLRWWSLSNGPHPGVKSRETKFY